MIKVLDAPYDSSTESKLFANIKFISDISYNELLKILIRLLNKKDKCTITSQFINNKNVAGE